MNHRKLRLLKLFPALGALLIFCSTAWAAVPQFITFEGVLRNPDGTPVADSTYNLTFRIWDAQTGGNVAWVSVSTPLATSKGLFNSILLAPQSAFTSDQRWLGITVEPDANELDPRIQLGSVGYAYRVGSVDGATGGDVFGDLRLHSTLRVGDLSGNIGRIEVTDGSTNTITADGTKGDLTALGKATIGPGHTNTGNFAFVAGKNNFAIGNFSTIGGGLINTAYDSASTVGGGFNNLVLGTGSVIGGGIANFDSGYAVTIGGGEGNVATITSYATIGGGHANAANGIGATVGGGQNNNASNFGTTVGGGENNATSGNYATVGGGLSNNAGNSYATVGGGVADTASGFASAVPGGFANKASGEYSFAAGRQAKALHDGSFVWGGGPLGDIASTGFGQFIVSAAGGIWLGFNNSPSIPAGDFLNTSTGAHLTLAGVWTDNSDKNRKENFAPLDCRGLLDKLAKLSITRWNYKVDCPEIKHIGPTAQDFYALFELGNDDKSIAPLDEAGVALAAIQGLYKIVQEQRQRIERLEVKLKEMQGQKRQAKVE